ncbi:MAG: hypothetical protein KME45_15765 [Stenomitos rutilans HA7619-LM2]|jgi:hypothetical protein|nr:hypothetical protein [Stenomitos rutilans HA7619-LM2]
MDSAGNTAEMRHRIDSYLEQLSPARLQLAADFLAALAEKDSEEATQELLDIPEFIESFERGRQDIAEGRITDWRAVRSDV